MRKPIPALPLRNIQQWETRSVLKKCAEAHRYLAELKGVAASIPNEAILINTLTLQEAKDSSEIENIVTTQDELFKADLFSESYSNPAAKEVQDYATALRAGFDRVRKSKIIRLADVLHIQQIIEKNQAGLRRQAGTVLKSTKTGDVIYSPPQEPQEIERLVSNLLDYMNDDSLCDADPLVKMALIHHQFESIHPFYDGNGRTGRIINILYLVAKGLMDLPVLYLSRFIIQNKSAYYSGLQAVRDNEDWEPWLLYMLNGVVQTAQTTIQLVKEIKLLMARYKITIRTALPNVYRQELLNNLFSHPYTKIDFVMSDLQVSRITATKYLGQLVELELIAKKKIGRSNYYVNQPLVALFLN